MKLRHIKNLDNFFAVLDTCEGKVELVSPNLRINLQSNLARYFGIAQLFASGSDEVEEIEIVAYEMEDIHRLMKFAMEDNISTSLK